MGKVERTHGANSALSELNLPLVRPTDLLAKASGRRLVARNMAVALTEDNRHTVAICVYQIMALYELSYREVAEIHADFAMRLTDE